MIVLGFLIFWCILRTWQTLDLLQFFQIHEYDNRRFFSWGLGKFQKITRPYELLILLPLIGVMFIGPEKNEILWGLFILLCWILIGVDAYRSRRKAKEKTIKPLVITARVKRLLVGITFVVLAEITALIWLCLSFSSQAFSVGGSVFPSGWFIFLVVLVILGQVHAVNIILANGLLYPYEESSRRYFIGTARKKVETMQPLVIGITGSYGKTTVKEMTAHILSTRFSTLKTPKSFNTVMGISRIIREDLQPTHRMLVVEMGAYKSGEIRQLCELTHPRIGILTAIGPQHLERFKTLGNVARAKYELIAALPPEGTGIFNGDDPLCAQLADQTKIKTLRYGFNTADKRIDLFAENMTSDEQGSKFEVVYQNTRMNARLPVLGRHNVLNSLGAMLAAIECGIPFKEALRGLASVPQIEHRLQLKVGENDILTIDDAYNANPLGAKSALEVLASFEGRRKVMVTPGFAEMGSLEKQAHYDLGKHAAPVCDYVFLIGDERRIAPIKAGLLESGMDAHAIFACETLQNARGIMKELLRSGDVVLFENDLPDIY